MRVKGVATAVTIGVLMVSATASAYDPRFTHRWITRTAAAYLVAAYPGQYDELLAYVDEVAAGSEHEDDYLLDGDDDPGTLRVMRHFYRPTDGAGLSIYGATYPSSYEWAIEPGGHNQWSWSAGQQAYRDGDLAEAYFVLGHMVHLIQDLTVPAHTHLDVHGPPHGDDYESYCTSQMIDEFSSLLPVPAPGTPIPLFASPYDAWQATARASYWRNMYPGDLSDTDQARGLVAEMFPALAWSWFFEDWRISDPAVGRLGRDFFEQAPGWFYFKHAKHAAEVDFVDYDPREPALSRVGANDDGLTMVEGFARDLIPIAILHSAGVMKLYLDEAYAHRDQPAPEEPLAEPPDAAGCAAAGSTADGSLTLLLFSLLLFAAFRRRNRCAA